MDARISLFVLVTLLLGCSCIDRRVLNKKPPGMPWIDVKKCMGRWYIMATENPCSWKGADTFTDWYHEYQLGPNPGQIKGMATWRSGDSCVRVPVKLTMTGPSSYTIVDSIGDVSTSTAVFVATDCTCFALAWGCTKWSIDGHTCMDPWISLNTRKPTLTPEVRRMTDQIFQKIWGINTEDILLIPHRKSCDRPKPLYK